MHVENVENLWLKLMGHNLNYAIIDEAGRVIELDGSVLHVAELPILDVLDHLRLRVEDDVVFVARRVLESFWEHLLDETLPFTGEYFNFIFNYKGVIISFDEFPALFSFLYLVKNFVLTEEALVVDLAVVG